MSTTRVLLLLFSSIFFLFSLFCFTPFSHFSSPILAKTLSFFHDITHQPQPQPQPHAVFSVSTSHHRRQRSGKLILQSTSPAVDEKDVVVLTKNNFSDFLDRNHYVMMNFYAPWCHWSRKLAPEYAAAATLLKGKAVLAKIDATQETELARKFDIQGYPTMFLSVGGVYKERYSYYQERNRDAISNWVNQKINNIAQNVTTVDEAKRILAAKESVMVLGFLDTLQGPQSEELAAVSKLHVDVKFYQTSNVEVAKLFHIDHQIKRPALIMLKREHYGNLSNFVYEDQFTRLAMANFVSVYKLPSVKAFTEEDASDIFDNPMKQLWLFTPERSCNVVSIFKKVANAFRGKLLFVHVEMGDEFSVGRKLYHEFGLTEESPTLVAYYKANGDVKKHTYHGALTSCCIKSFAEEFLKDKLVIKSSEPSMKTVDGLPFYSHASDPSSIPHAY